MKTPSTFGKRLKAARYMAEMSADDMGQLLDISGGTYANYESDRTKPSIDQLPTICRALEVSSDWLLGISP